MQWQGQDVEGRQATYRACNTSLKVNCRFPSYLIATSRCYYLDHRMGGGRANSTNKTGILGFSVSGVWVWSSVFGRCQANNRTQYELGAEQV